MAVKKYDARSRARTEACPALGGTIFDSRKNIFWLCVFNGMPTVALRDAVSSESCLVRILDTPCFREHSPAYPSIILPRKEAYHAVLSSPSQLHARGPGPAHCQSPGPL